MSTNYDLTKIGFDYEALKTEGAKVGLVAVANKDNDKDSQCYQCGSSYIWAYRVANGVSFTRYGLSTGEEVEALEKLAEAIGAELLDEYEVCELCDEGVSEEEIFSIEKVLTAIP